jgi:hypothetical protein
MADEATVFSLTTAEMATDVADQAGGADVDVATEDAATVTASIDIGLYFLKDPYEDTDGRSKLLRHLEKIRAKIIGSDWPPV